MYKICSPLSHFLITFNSKNGIFLEKKKKGYFIFRENIVEGGSNFFFFFLRKNRLFNFQSLSVDTLWFPKVLCFLAKWYS